MAPPTEDPTERLNFLPDFPGRESLYHPLDANKDEIRVITVQPSQERSSTIHCFLQTISIQDGRSTKPYDAISYYWGSTETTDTIVVHDGLSIDKPGCGVEVPVTYALTGAIRQFRAKAFEWGCPLVLWTDAVCINQLDVAERSQQVTMMQTVYEAAGSVLVWLGEGDPVAEMGLINLFGLAMYRQCNVADHDDETDAFDYYDFDATPDLESLERVDMILMSLDEPDAYKDECEPDIEELGKDMTSWVQIVWTFLDLDYWYWGWTFQEACINEQVWLHYGQSRCRVKRLNFLADFFDSTPNFWKWLEMWQARPFLRLVDWITAMSLARTTVITLKKFGGITRRDIIEMRGGAFAEMVKQELRTLARTSRQTSDPRDQVYSRLTSSVWFMFLGLKPDYTLTTAQVFIATTTAILHASQSWAHEQFFSPSKSPFMPSWAIDFSLSPDQDSRLESSVRFPGGELRADAMASFRLQESQLGSLSTAGFIYDDVVFAAPSDRFGDDDVTLAWTHVFSAEDSFRYLKRNNVYSTAEDLMIAYYRTRCIGLVDQVKFGPEHCAVFVAAMFNNEELDDYRRDPFDRINVGGRFHHNIGMKLIITRKGHMGLVAQSVNVGDRIAILATGTVPFALKKVSKQNGHDAYILLGGCYVDGIMYGEAASQRVIDI